MRRLEMNSSDIVTKRKYEDVYVILEKLKKVDFSIYPISIEFMAVELGTLISIVSLWLEQMTGEYPKEEFDEILDEALSRPGVPAMVRWLKKIP